MIMIHTIIIKIIYLKKTKHADSSSVGELEVPFVDPDSSPRKALKTEEGKTKADRPKLRRKVVLNKRKNPFIDDDAACADESDE